MSELTAPAKLTWSLEITGRRSDGWHELRSEMVTLSLVDRLSLNKSGHGVRFVNNDAIDPSHNLVTRALALVGRTAVVVVEKNIPVGGGLGGGSADAAAILRWAGGVSDEEALTLGSDVPFCQLGGWALVEGVGERLTPHAFREELVTLLVPSFSISTADCYRVFDELVDEGWRPKGRNHLEAPARRHSPALDQTLHWLREDRGLDAHLAGSGSTMFLEGHHELGDVTGPAGKLTVWHVVTTPR